MKLKISKIKIEFMIKVNHKFYKMNDDTIRDFYVRHYSEYYTFFSDFEIKKYDGLRNHIVFKIIQCIEKKDLKKLQDICYQLDNTVNNVYSPIIQRLFYKHLDIINLHIDSEEINFLVKYTCKVRNNYYDPIIIDYSALVKTKEDRKIYKKLNSLGFPCKKRYDEKSYYDYEILRQIENCYGQRNKSYKYKIYLKKIFIIAKDLIEYNSVRVMKYLIKLLEQYKLIDDLAYAFFKDADVLLTKYIKHQATTLFLSSNFTFAEDQLRGIFYIDHWNSYLSKVYTGMRGEFYCNWELYKEATSLSLPLCFISVDIGEETISIPIVNELLFMINYCNYCIKGHLRFLQNFREVCSNTDFSDEYN